jgi:hypothetical protein
MIEGSRTRTYAGARTGMGDRGGRGENSVWERVKVGEVCIWEGLGRGGGRKGGGERKGEGRKGGGGGGRRGRRKRKRGRIIMSFYFGGSEDGKKRKSPNLFGDSDAVQPSGNSSFFDNPNTESGSDNFFDDRSKNQSGGNKSLFGVWIVEERGIPAWLDGVRVTK